MMNLQTDILLRLEEEQKNLSKENKAVKETLSKVTEKTPLKHIPGR